MSMMIGSPDSTGIKPGQGFLALRLPIPVSAMALISDLVERVYGTGETNLRMEGDQYTLHAPKDGFGPLKSGGRRPNRPTADDMKIVSALLDDDGNVKMTLEDAQERVLFLSQMLRLWFEGVGGINYVETQIITKGGEAEYILTLQKNHKPTPHEFRLTAERERDEAYALLRTLGAADPLGYSAAINVTFDEGRITPKAAVDLGVVGGLVDFANATDTPGDTETPEVVAP